MPKVKSISVSRRSNIAHPCSNKNNDLYNVTYGFSQIHSEVTLHADLIDKESVEDAVGELSKQASELLASDLKTQWLVDVSKAKQRNGEKK